MKYSQSQTALMCMFSVWDEFNEARLVSFKKLAGLSRSFAGSVVNFTISKFS